MSACHVVNYSQKSACPREMEPFKDHLSTHGYLTSLSIIATTKASRANLPPIPSYPNCQLMLYSYHLMVKSMSYCCVHGSWLFSNPVTVKATCMHDIRTVTHTCTCNAIKPFIFDHAISSIYCYFVLQLLQISVIS